jgi:hypothetical protein
MSKGTEYLGGFFEAEMQNSGKISGIMCLWFSRVAYDADYLEPVEFTRNTP